MSIVKDSTVERVRLHGEGLTNQARQVLAEPVGTLFELVEGENYPSDTDSRTYLNKLGVVLRRLGAKTVRGHHEDGRFVLVVLEKRAPTWVSRPRPEPEYQRLFDRPVGSVVRFKQGKDFTCEPETFRNRLHGAARYRGYRVIADIDGGLVKAKIRPISG